MISLRQTITDDNLLSFLNNVQGSTCCICICTPVYNSERYVTMYICTCT